MHSAHIRHGYDSELNHESTQNQLFFLLESWVELIQYLGICLSYELILSQIPGKPLESWVDLNQYLGICLFRELILSQFHEKPLESWVESTQTSWVMSWFESILGKTLESNPQKRSHIPKKVTPTQDTLVESPKKVIRSEIQRKVGYWINSIIESWVDSNQYSIFFSHESIWIKILKSVLSHELIWIKFLESFLSHEL